MNKRKPLNPTDIKWHTFRKKLNERKEIILSKTEIAFNTYLIPSKVLQLLSFSLSLDAPHNANCSPSFVIASPRVSTELTIIKSLDNLSVRVWRSFLNVKRLNYISVAEKEMQTPAILEQQLHIFHDQSYHELKGMQVKYDIMPRNL